MHGYHAKIGRRKFRAHIKNSENKTSETRKQRKRETNLHKLRDFPHNKKFNVMSHNLQNSYTIDAEICRFAIPSDISGSSDGTLA
jgi:hypothetical protein